MKKIFLVLSIVACTFILVQSCGNDDASKAKADSVSSSPPAVGASVNGSVLYEEKCMVCHGADGKQNTMGAADLSSSTLDHAIVVSIITSGKNTMKAFSPELNAEQIEAVAKYAESLRK